MPKIWYGAVNADEAVVDTATLFPILKNKAKMLIYILFSKSGLAGQHNYLTPIVSMSFLLTSIPKHH